MIFDPTIDGRLIRHTESFRGGTARARLVVPANAGAKLLKLTIRAAGLSATTVASFAVAGGTPTLSIADASVAEGNSGTTLSLPVTLSTAASAARLGQLRDVGRVGDRTIRLCRGER